MRVNEDGMPVDENEMPVGEVEMAVSEVKMTVDKEGMPVDEDGMRVDENECTLVRMDSLPKNLLLQKEQKACSGTYIQMALLVMMVMSRA